MEERRKELHELLCKILGSRNCYFSPPNGFKMRYPCIIYDLSDIDKISADNLTYRKMVSYTLTLINPKKDLDLVSKILELKYCRFDRQFSSDNLNHYVFTLYF